MRLKMDLDGIRLGLNIKNYTVSNDEDWHSQWCKVDFSFSSGKWLDYHRENDEVLLACEVEKLADRIEQLLNDDLEEVTQVACVEPDFTFYLHPKRDLRKDPSVLYVREGCEIVDICAEWTVTFWNEGLTDNYLSVTLDRGDLEILLAYLHCVIGKCDACDHRIEELIKEGFLIAGE